MSGVREKDNVTLVPGQFAWLAGRDGGSDGVAEGLGRPRYTDSSRQETAFKLFTTLALIVKPYMHDTNCVSYQCCCK